MNNAVTTSVDRAPLFPDLALNPYLSNIGWQFDGVTFGGHTFGVGTADDLIADLNDEHGQRISSMPPTEPGNKEEETQDDMTWIEVDRLVKSGRVTSPKEGPWHNISRVQGLKRQPKRLNDTRTRAMRHSSTKAQDGDGTTLLRPKLA